MFECMFVALWLIAGTDGTDSARLLLDEIWKKGRERRRRRSTSCQTNLHQWLADNADHIGRSAFKFNKPQSPWWIVTWESYCVVSMRQSMTDMPMLALITVWWSIHR